MHIYMESSCFSFTLFLLLLCSSINEPFSSATTLPNSTTDQNALLIFKNTITSDPNATLSNNWSTNTSVCNWIGVSCGNKHQRVISLNISGFDLSGTLPPHLGNLTFLRSLDISSNDFTGPIPSELSRLYRLRFINMQINSFAGYIPSWLGALPQLEILALGNNSFSGPIPSSLFTNNSRLQTLSMRFNYLNGSIPDEIGNSSSLQVLNLNNNQLTGPIPHGLFNVSSIREIRVMYNGLSGTLPSDMCNNLPNVTRLLISANQIEGQIPRNIWKCRVLEIISLSINRFSGEIPSEIGSLSMLRELFLGVNGFQGGVPAEFGNLSRLELLSLRPIPKEIGNCTSLILFELSDNYLTGGLPEELGNSEFLEFFNVRNNSLSGSIPSSIFNISTLMQVGLAYNQFTGDLGFLSESSLSNLEELYMSNNMLTGEIPSSITNASRLTILSMANNSFTGFIPNFSNLRLLQRLWLWNNHLRGAESPHQELTFLSSLANCQYLEILAISGNPLNGVLPASVGNLSSMTLHTFFAENCNINGVIPSTIANLSSLQSLLLSNNELTGVIPPTIGKLIRLQRLYLYGNRLQGYIPLDLCRSSMMVYLYLNDNMLTGPIPECLGDVRSLNDINLGSNRFNSTIPSNLWNLTDTLFLNLSSNYLTGQLPSQIASLRVVQKLDLSHNQLSGVIPRSIDSCQSLGFLSLSNNNLSGSIPPSLGNITGLSTLDLSNNNLSGTIPDSLEGLNLLQHFNVSHNNLEGEIPTGGHFSNFTSQSFLNNSALCGETRFQVARCITEDIGKSRLRKVGRLMKYILPPFIFIIILAAIIVLVLMRRQKLRRSAPAPTDDISLGVSWRRISYIELVRGTNEFSETNLLGTGGFGSVFKATLFDGLIVAVKVFNLQLERVVRSFDTECEVLSNVRHRNLVQIIGCCTNKEFKALILGYMPNGNLEKLLYSESYCLDLIQSLQIAIDVASALEYLHHGHTFPVVHCDIKPSNVLLDEEMVAHLGDFGISKLFENGETMVQTKTLATIGYAAPEYGLEGKVSTSGDVYSYGIFLLELLTRKKPTDNMFNEEMSLKDWVYKSLQENAVTEVVALGLLAREEDQNLCAKLEECASSIFSLAMKCLIVSPDQRINMIETGVSLHRIKAKVVAVQQHRTRA
ncbi:hypothetical protein CASFOL_016315 [Castilleja foliolosa]|uniref:non-specific serine/threonine protein kinase n=1 Tax=Castilleja foliolosa TaxID=1961234 RepID=A0ABD3DI51_9LAMI